MVDQFLVAVAAWFLGAHTLFAQQNTAADLGQVADRLILSINDQSYSQRATEVFIAIREALRSDLSPNIESPMNARLWNEALSVFIDEMVILSEADRTSSFMPSESVIRVAEQRVRQRLESVAGFRANMSRLGVNSATIRSVVINILRAESYRRTKDRQALSASESDEVKIDVEGESPRNLVAGNWLTQAKIRAVVRQYQGANVFRALSGF